MVNLYFRLKAGEVLGNEGALSLLSNLYEKTVIPKDEWENLNINKGAIDLAMLAAAGFCEVSKHSIRITDAGIEFIKYLLEENKG